ncbi:MAG TPA: hypothetical protein VFD77_03665 [Brumimicrobium sp.]|nr:hypothetical protein [Brumimicrobium sp.]
MLGNKKLLDGKNSSLVIIKHYDKANREGLKGAFPSLVGSKVVLDDAIKLFVDITMIEYKT